MTYLVGRNWGRSYAAFFIEALNSRGRTDLAAMPDQPHPNHLALPPPATGDRAAGSLTVELAAFGFSGRDATGSFIRGFAI